MENQLLKQTLGSIFASRAEKFTFDVQMGKYNKAPKIEKATASERKQKFHIGDWVITAETDVFKPGLKFQVTDACQIDSGYWSYFFGGVWHKQCDIVKARA